MKEGAHNEDKLLKSAVGGGNLSCGNFGEGGGGISLNITKKKK